MMLAEYGLETMDISMGKSGAHHLHIRERLEVTRGMLDQVRLGVYGQLLAIYKVALMLEMLYRIVDSELRASWKSLQNMVVSVWRFTVC